MKLSISIYCILNIFQVCALLVKFVLFVIVCVSVECGLLFCNEVIMNDYGR